MASQRHAKKSMQHPRWRVLLWHSRRRDPLLPSQLRLQPSPSCGWPFCGTAAMLLHLRVQLVVRQVAASLSEAGAAELVDEHNNQATAKAAKRQCPSGVRITSSKHASTLLHVRIADAKAFAAWAAANGLDFRATEARRKIRQYLKESSAVAVMSEAELRRGLEYLARCLKLHMNDAIVLPTKVATRPPNSRGGGVPYRSRRRRRH